VSLAASRAFSLSILALAIAKSSYDATEVVSLMSFEGPTALLAAVWFLGAMVAV
jgi:hypothetical protein